MITRWGFSGILGIVLYVMGITMAHASLVTFKFTGEILEIHREGGFNENPSDPPGLPYVGPAITGYVTYNTALVGLPLAVSPGPVIDVTIVGAPTVQLLTKDLSWPIPGCMAGACEAAYYNTPGRIPVSGITEGIGGEVIPIKLIGVIPSELIGAFNHVDLLELGVGLVDSPPGLNYTLHVPGSFNISCTGGCGSTGNWGFGTLTSLTVVPLPPSVLLFGAGLIALVGLGAGRRLISKASAARFLSAAS